MMPLREVSLSFFTLQLTEDPDENQLDMRHIGAEPAVPVFGRAEVIHPARPAPYKLFLPAPEDNSREQVNDEVMFTTANAGNTPCPSMTQALFASLSPEAQLAVSSDMFGLDGTHRPSAAPSASVGPGDAEPTAVGEAEPVPAEAATGGPSL